MTLSVAGSNSAAVGKQKRHCGSRPAPGFGHVGVGIDNLRALFRQYLGIIKHKLWELAQNDFRVREAREYNRQASAIDDRG